MAPRWSDECGQVVLACVGQSWPGSWSRFWAAGHPPPAPRPGRILSYGLQTLGNREEEASSGETRLEEVTACSARWKYGQEGSVKR